jgi:hypothetical protein
MNQSELKLFARKTSKIRGWFSPHDQIVFNAILTWQERISLNGDLLEIGVYAGKSAVLIGRFVKPNQVFHVCDVFDSDTDLKNAEEIAHSYQDLSRKSFEKNCVEFLGYIPKIYHGLSSELPFKLNDKTFRFIHIDGSHLYPHVSQDLLYSISFMDNDFGVIAVDDYRAQHTVGVAQAVWELVLSGKLVPILMTPAKIYLVGRESKVDAESIRVMMKDLNINIVEDEICGYKVVRTIGLSDVELYSNPNSLKRFFPPIVIDLLRKSQTWKRIRH